MSTKGRLLLVPAPLDFGCASTTPLQDVLPQGTLVAAAQLGHWVCENAKSARAYLKRIDALVPLTHPLQQLDIQELPHAVHKKGDHRGEFDARSLLAPALAGHDMGLLSEAGMPAIAECRFCRLFAPRRQRAPNALAPTGKHRPQQRSKPNLH